MGKLLPENFAEAIGWTIFHSIWQIALIAALLGILLIILGKFSAQLRYFIASVCYIFILGVGVYTFINNYENQKNIIAKRTEQRISQTQTNNWVIPEIMYSDKEELPFLKSQLQEMKSFFSSHFGIIAMVWVFGIMLLSLKFLGNLVYLQRMKNYRVIPLNKNWQDKMLVLKEKLEISKKIRLLQSSLAKVPMVVGFVKPVILMPLSALSGLSAKEIECIIAHELAHIKRNDYFINILQKIVEILFFYHPAVWWISSVVKIERENCCDDIAVSLTGDSVNFVKALANMEEKRFRAEHLAVAFSTSKNQLLKRVQRILNQRKMKSNFNEGIIASCVIFLGFLTMAFSTGFSPDANQLQATDAVVFEKINMEAKDTTQNSEQYNTLKNLEEGKSTEKQESHSEEIAQKEKEYQKQQERQKEKEREELERAHKELEKAKQQLIEAEKELQKAHEKLSKKEQKEIEKAKVELQAAHEELERAQREMVEAEEEIIRKEHEIHEEIIYSYHHDEDLDDIIEDALEGIEEAFEEIDEEEISEAIEEAMEEVSEAIGEIDFDEIFNEISEALHDVSEEIEVDVIIDEIRAGLKEARHDVKYRNHSSHNEDIVRDHVSKLTEGVEAWNEWRINSPGLIPQLRGTTLYDFDLSGINFEEAELSGAELKEVNLSNANLFNAQLREANLKEANLSGANLREASFVSAELKEANLQNADARHTSFRYANLKEADLTNADLREADLSGVDLSQATVDGAKFKGAKANKNTFFPPDFNIEKEGVILR